MSEHSLVRLALSGLTVAVALLGLGAGAPARAEEVGCDTIDLTFDAKDLSTHCYAGSGSGRNPGGWGGGWRVTYETIGADTRDISIVVQVDRAGRYTYMERGVLRDQVGVEPWFSDSRDWGDAYDLEGYEVQEFEGTWKGVADYWACAGFARYSGYVHGTTGYREVVTGAYCVPGQELPTGELRRILNSIRY